MRQIFWMATALAGILLVACTSAPAPAPTPAPEVKNLAIGKKLTSNGHIYDFVAANAVDGEVLSYFEGPADHYPNTLTIDLGTVRTVTSQVLRLNPKRIWQARSQTIEVKASTDGTEFSTVLGANAYAFDPEENHNAVTLTWTGKARYLQLVGTANSEATALQLAEWEILGY